MVSSVAIDDALRIKLKILAAKHDTTQAEIIRRAISLLESQEKISDYQPTEKVKLELQKASKIVFRDNPSRKRIATALEKPGIDIDDLRMAFNG